METVGRRRREDVSRRRQRYWAVGGVMLRWGELREEEEKDEEEMGEM